MWFSHQTINIEKFQYIKLNKNQVTCMKQV